MALPLAFIVLVALSSYLAPQLSRRDIFFGVTVPAGLRDGPDASAVSRRYAMEVWGLAVVAAALVWTSPMPVISGPMLLAQTVGGFVAFSRARQAVHPHAAAPAMIREADIGPRQQLPGGLVGQLGPFLILLAAAAYLGWHWEDIPARFPTHGNLAGAANGWTEKSVGGVFRGVSLGFIAGAMMLFTSYAVLYWTRLPRVSGADGAQSRRVRRVNLMATLAWEYLMALLLAWTSMVSMFSGEGSRPHLPLVFRIAPFALVLIATVTIRAMRRAAVSNGLPQGDTTPDSRWLFGHLYVNRADPTLFVERRMGLGYTLNLGNPVSWLVLTAFVVAMSIPLLLVP